MAAPLVAGTVAVLREMADRYGIVVTPEGLAHLLCMTGPGVFDGDDEDDNVTNSMRSYPRLDVAAALAALTSNPDLARLSAGPCLQ